MNISTLLGPIKYHIGGGFRACYISRS